MKTLPLAGWTRDQIERSLMTFHDTDPPRRKSALSTGAHYVSDDIQQVLRTAHQLFAHHNDVVLLRGQGARDLEQEVLEIAAGLLGGGTPGVVTSIALSGSESALNVLYAARERACRERPEVTEPEVVAPATVHPAFAKAAAYLGLRLRRAELDGSLRSTTAAVASLVNPQTIAVVGSAPDFHFGYFDDIEGLGRLAAAHGLWCHVDAMTGGLLSPFAAAVGETIPPWDLSVPGVTSVAAGLGTWGYGMKPTAVIAWRDHIALDEAIMEVSDWPGERYITPGFSGTRPMGPVAAAWAVFHHLGRRGYELLAEHLVDGKRVFAERLAAVPGITILEPGLTTINYRHEAIGVEALVQGMAERGWSHFTCSSPPLVTLVLDAASVDVMDEYLADLAGVVAGASAATA
jgi:sphinganine-1-phosphate aldolase